MTRPINEAQRRIAWQIVWDMNNNPDGVPASQWRDRWPYHSLRLAIGCLRQHNAPLAYVHRGRRWALRSRWPLPVTLWPRHRLIAHVLLDGAGHRVRQLEMRLDELLGPVPS